jgi:hypothetical protein
MREVFWNRTWKITGYENVKYEDYSIWDVMTRPVYRDQRFGEFR